MSTVFLGPRPPSPLAPRRLGRRLALGGRRLLRGRRVPRLRPREAVLLRPPLRSSLRVLLLEGAAVLEDVPKPV